MSQEQEHVSGSMTEESSYRNRKLTVPNVICIFRLVGSLALPGIAWSGSVDIFAWLFVVLSLSDWIDGKLARWLNQRSAFGARIDSLADSVLYAGFFAGVAVLMKEVLREESAWWFTALASYVLTTSAGLWKYGRIPSYHTRGAKISYWFILVGGLCLVLGVSVWPFRLAMLSVTITNLEATAITWYLPKWTCDIRSFRDAVASNGRLQDGSQ